METIEKNIEELGNKMNVLLYGKIIHPPSFPDKYLPEMAVTDYIRDGSHGVVEHNTLDFSDRFKKYGMQTIKRGRR